MLLSVRVYAHMHEASVVRVYTVFGCLSRYKDVVYYLSSQQFIARIQVAIVGDICKGISS